MIRRAEQARDLGFRVFTIGLGRPDAEDPLDRINPLLRLVADEPRRPKGYTVRLVELCLRIRRVTKIKAHPGDREFTLQALRLTTQLRIRSVHVEYPAVVELAENTGLTAYDAAYLWLARQLGAPLVTLDRRLAAAARSVA